jgi:AcrR family transcriptional regulator
VSSYSRVRASALELFAARGFQATGIRDLAAASGLSLATLYYYMNNKEELLFGLMSESLERLQDDAETVLKEVHTPIEGLAALTIMHVLAHGLRQTQTVVVDTELRSLNEEHRAKIVELRDGYEQLWRQQLSDGAAQGMLSVPDLRITRLALLEMCTGVAYWYAPHGELELDDVAAVHADLVLAQVQARRGRKRLQLEDLDLPQVAWYHELVARQTSDTSGKHAAVVR